MKSDLEILLFIYRQPEHRSSLADLKAFIGENADRRISSLRLSHHIRQPGSWSAATPPPYILDIEGERLILAAQERAQEAAEKQAEEQAAEERQRAQTEASEAANRRNNIISALIGAVVGSLLTFTLDHLPAILRAFSEFFK